MSRKAKMKMKTHIYEKGKDPLYGMFGPEMPWELFSIFQTCVMLEEDKRKKEDREFKLYYPPAWIIPQIVNDERKLNAIIQSYGYTIEEFKEKQLQLME